MPTGPKMSEGQAYERIAVLNGERQTLEHNRYLIVKAIREMRNLIDDGYVWGEEETALRTNLSTAIDILTVKKSQIWDRIIPIDLEIDRLTQLAQNGAFSK